MQKVATKTHDLLFVWVYSIIKHMLFSKQNKFWLYISFKYKDKVTFTQFTHIVKFPMYYDVVTIALHI